VLLSGFVREESVPGQVLSSGLARIFELVTSLPLVEEVRRGFDDSYFRQRLTPAQITAKLRLLDERATLVAITAAVHGVATHPEDDLILATAVSANADYVVTGDRGLQRLGTYQGTIILSPREFLDVLIAGGLA
jgi:putative PIN family toxin of toxin-antitoxin system